MKTTAPLAAGSCNPSTSTQTLKNIMKKPNITKGEWEWSHGVSVYTDSVIIATSRQLEGHADRPNPPMDEQKANAKAIAALPQVLGAMEMVYWYFAEIDRMRPEANRGTVGQSTREAVSAALLAAGYSE
jgi:hypothetical protein